MKANEAPEKIYIPRLINDGKLIHEWNDVPFKKFRFFFDKEIAENIEYTRTDAFIGQMKAWLMDNSANYMMYDPLTSSACLEVEKMIEDFENYIKGE